MARLYALLGTAHGLGKPIVDAIPGMTYSTGSVEFKRNGKSLVCLLLDVAKDYDLGPDSAAPSKKWDVWLLVADSGADALPDGTETVESRKWLKRVYRHLHRRAATHPTYLFGPYSLKQAKENWPATVKALLNEKTYDEDGNVNGTTDNWGYPSLLGDDLDACAEEDYRPSQGDIDNDVDD